MVWAEKAVKQATIWGKSVSGSKGAKHIGPEMKKGLV